jgi:Cu(I)/Ag(I) efflux system membrane fusion protein
MKSVRRSFVLAVAVVAVLAAAPSEALKAIVGSYLEMQAQLAADKFDGLETLSQGITLQAAQMGPAGESIGKAVSAVEAATDLKTARDAFAVLSDAVIAAARAEGWAELPDVKVAYCPMVNRSWLQRGDKIRNPYYGSKMPECGEFKKR